MMYCLVRSLRSRRPSTMTFLMSATMTLRRRRRWQNPIDHPHPHLTGLFDREAMVLAHARPAFEIGQCFERNQGVAPRRLGKGSQLRSIHQLQPSEDQLTGQPDARPELVRIGLVGIECPPH